MSIPGIAESISNNAINEAQRAEMTPSDQILPPHASGSYRVDERVIACQLVPPLVQ